MAWLVITRPSSNNLGVWYVINWPVISHCILESTDYWRMCSTRTFFKPNLVGLSYKQRCYCLINNLLMPSLYSWDFNKTWNALFWPGSPQLKLDGVGPVDNRPSSNKLHHFVRKKSDMWHVTPDMWHVTRYMWHVTRLGGWTFSQNFSSLAFTVCDLWYYEDLEEKDDSMNKWINELINHETVYRTAPATPGLLW